MHLHWRREGVCFVENSSSIKSNNNPAYCKNIILISPLWYVQAIEATLPVIKIISTLIRAIFKLSQPRAISLELILYSHSQHFQLKSIFYNLYSFSFQLCIDKNNAALDMMPIVHGLVLANVQPDVVIHCHLSSKINFIFFILYLNLTFQVVELN